MNIFISLSPLKCWLDNTTYSSWSNTALGCETAWNELVTFFFQNDMHAWAYFNLCKTALNLNFPNLKDNLCYLYRWPRTVGFSKFKKKISRTLNSNLPHSSGKHCSSLYSGSMKSILLKYSSMHRLFIIQLDRNA